MLRNRAKRKYGTVAQEIQFSEFYRTAIINFHQSAINDHQCCVLAHASPLSVLKHALGRKCSLMATPSKRDSVNAQSSFKFRSVDSQTISF